MKVGSRYYEILCRYYCHYWNIYKIIDFLIYNFCSHFFNTNLIFTKLIFGKLNIFLFTYILFAMNWVWAISVNGKVCNTSLKWWNSFIPSIIIKSSLRTIYKFYFLSHQYALLSRSTKVSNKYKKDISLLDYICLNKLCIQRVRLQWESGMIHEGSGCCMMSTERLYVSIRVY